VEVLGAVIGRSLVMMPERSLNSPLVRAFYAVNVAAHLFLGGLLIHGRSLPIPTAPAGCVIDRRVSLMDGRG
jgi:hypothetical protein